MLKIFCFLEPGASLERALLISVCLKHPMPTRGHRRAVLKSSGLRRSHRAPSVCQARRQVSGDGSSCPRSRGIGPSRTSGKVKRFLDHASAGARWHSVTKKHGRVCDLADAAEPVLGFVSEQRSRVPTKNISGGHRMSTACPVCRTGSSTDSYACVSLPSPALPHT